MEEVFETKVDQLIPVSDPYPDKTPSEILCRQYLIAEVPVTNGTLKSLQPTSLLLAIPTLQSYLSRFRYLRSSLKLTFLLVSNQMQYGLIGISFLPYTSDLVSWLTVQQRSQANMHLLDISEQEGLEIILPYLSPKMFWDLTDPTTYGTAWRVDIGAFPIGTASTATSSTVLLKVFASFEEPSTAGYVAQGAFQSGLPGDRQPLRRAAGMASAASGFGNLLLNNGREWMSNTLGSATARNAMAASATLGTAYKTVSLLSQGAETVSRMVEEPSEPVKLELAPDLSCPGATKVSAKLGDPSPKLYKFLPQINNHSSLSTVCMVPTYTNTFELLDTTVNSISTSPFNANSYASYVRPMYKYFRGSSMVCLKFATSPLVSGRVKITLYPASGVGASVNTIGDVPSWIVTVKGPTSWCLEVPYLALTPWANPDTYVFPTLTVELMDALPQPFDKVVSIFCNVFQSTGSDFQFAGLQSFVPGPTAQFQCSLASCFSKPEVIGKTFDFPYQGGVMDLSTILSRFSSRDPVPAFLFPFPIKITDAATSYQLDNFDYISNLFKFYSGDVNVKMLFSSGAAGGLLQTSVSNSNLSATGVSWKAGNSLAMTNQTVWPLLEFRYPYMNTVEFDSIWEPSGMYPQLVDETATLQNYFLSASDSFGLYYLLPVPDFSLTASFQSYVGPINRSSFQENYLGVVDVPTGSSYSTIAVTGLNFTQTQCVSVKATLTRNSGSANFKGLVVGSPSATDIPSFASSNVGFFCPVLLDWVDQSNNGNYVAKGSNSLAFSQYSSLTTMYFQFLKSDATVDATFFYSITFSPWSSISAISAPSYTTTVCDIASPTGIGVTVNNTVNTNLASADPSVVVPVSVANTVNTNLASVDSSVVVPVSVTSPVSISGDVSVQGMLNPAYPVWNSLYPSIG